MFDSDNTDYTKLYIKRQEVLLLEQIKKTIDLDVKVTMLSGILEQIRNEYNELQNQLNMQIDISNQAANGLQDMMEKNKELELKIENFRENIDINEKSHKLEIEIYKNKAAETDRRLGELIIEKDTKNTELQSCLKSTNNLERELVRQQKEMQEIFDENKELKTKKPINKKKSVEDDSDF
jgi:chromosome segregation ATPase